MQEQLLCFSSFTFPLSPFHLPEDLSKAQTETPSAVIWFACVYVRDVPEDPEGQKCIFLFLYQRIIQFIKVFRVFRDITNIHAIKLKQGWRPSYKGLQIFRLGPQGLQIFDRYTNHTRNTNKIEKPKIFSKIISPGEKNMNFVKIIFSGEHRIPEGAFGFLGPIHEPYTNQTQTISINSSHFFKCTPDTRTIHETRTKSKSRKFSPK